MSHELHYTSAPRGLKPGSQGFCTVKSTRGMPALLAEKLETLSVYRHAFAAQHPLADQNPVSFSHLRLSVGGEPWSVLSRIGFSGLDYSQRNNYFAHHVALAPSELPPGGPAWAASASAFLQPQWDGTVEQLPVGHLPPRTDRPSAVCQLWGQVAGDPGWAAALADHFQQLPDQPAYVLFEPGTDVLGLLVESLSLLPAAKRWAVTFNTYYTRLPPDVSCAWRCASRDSPEAAAARKTGGLVLDLAALPATPAHASALAQLARTGRETVVLSSPPQPIVQLQMSADESLSLTLEPQREITPRPSSQKKLVPKQSTAPPELPDYLSKSSARMWPYLLLGALPIAVVLALVVMFLIRQPDDPSALVEAPNQQKNSEPDLKPIRPAVTNPIASPLKSDGKAKVTEATNRPAKATTEDSKQKNPNAQNAKPQSGPNKQTTQSKASADLTYLENPLPTLPGIEKPSKDSDSRLVIRKAKPSSIGILGFPTKQFDVTFVPGPNDEIMQIVYRAGVSATVAPVQVAAFQFKDGGLFLKWGDKVNTIGDCTALAVLSGCVLHLPDESPHYIALCKTLPLAPLRTGSWPPKVSSPIPDSKTDSPVRRLIRIVKEPLLRDRLRIQVHGFSTDGQRRQSTQTVLATNWETEILKTEKLKKSVKLVANIVNPATSGVAIIVGIEPKIGSIDPERLAIDSKRNNVIRQIKNAQDQITSLEGKYSLPNSMEMKDALKKGIDRHKIDKLRLEKEKVDQDQIITELDKLKKDLQRIVAIADVELSLIVEIKQEKSPILIKLADFTRQTK